MPTTPLRTPATIAKTTGLGALIALLAACLALAASQLSPSHHDHQLVFDFRLPRSLLRRRALGRHLVVPLS